MKQMAWVWVFLVSMVVSAGMTALTGVPGAEAHDEFSYLLAADTFAHGRLTNPTPVGWEHFESFHILVRPTYQSKYQPGQGLMLGLGEAATGWPIVGAWLGAGLACAAIAWALEGVLAWRWAMLGGMLAALHPVMMLWSQNYWGGELAALGGALVFGGAVRLRKEKALGAAALMALGVVILFNTRPYEGGVLVLLVGTPLLLLGKGWRSWRVLGVMAAVLAVGASWNLYYDYRVTGNALKLPYLVHEGEYAMAPPFVWEGELPTKEYGVERIREYNEVELAHYRGQRTARGFVRAVGEKSLALVKAYGAQPVWGVVGLIGLVVAGRKSRMVWGVGLGLLVFLAALMPANWMFAHYAGPGVVLMVYLGVVGVKEVAGWGKWVLPVFLGVYFGTAVYWGVERMRSYPESWGRLRQTLVAGLVAEPGEDLVIVKEPAGGNINTEWVYNGADIEGSPVVFARDLGREKNGELMRYFKGRKVWWLDVGTGELRGYDSRD